MSLSGRAIAALVISAIVMSSLPLTEASVEVLPGGAPITFRLDDADITWSVSYTVERIEITNRSLEITELTGDIYEFIPDGAGAEISILGWAPHAVRGKVLSLSLDSGSAELNITGLNSKMYDIYVNGRQISTFSVKDNWGLLNVSTAGSLYDVVVNAAAPGSHSDDGTDDSPGNTNVTGSGNNNNLLLVILISGSLALICIVLLVRRRRR